MNVLVVGGAGYVGSHCVRRLIGAGHTPVVLDNLIYGHKEALPKDVKFYDGNIADKEFVRQILRDEQISIVMHFAAFAYVGESMQEPMKYYRNNLMATLELLDAMLEENVLKFVFSSTCATYGIPEKLPITEKTPQKPINPYGQTKLMVEQALMMLAITKGLSFASFRYFNAAGASPDGSIGEHHDPETHLLPLIFDQVLGKRKTVSVFGTDYDTPDGSCLRDYVHVDDLADAHILAFKKLELPKQQLFYNLGIGKPYSVKEVIKTVEDLVGQKVVVEEVARREGDPPVLYADALKARNELGWEPKYGDLKSIVETAWNWHKNHPDGYN